MPSAELSGNGFVLIDQFLDLETVKSLIASVASLPADGVASRLRRGAEFARRNLLAHRCVRELLEQSCVRQLLDQLGPGLIPVRAILFDKNPSANWTVPWHQDRSIAVRERTDMPGFGPWSTKAGVVHVQPPIEILTQMLTLRFHLDACGLDNGPLKVVPGSHREILNPSEIDQYIAESPKTLCTTDTGGLLVMRPLILHGSSPATRPSHRRVIHIEFGPGVLPDGIRWATA